ncbi:phage tail protein [Granulicella arctica]|uniref:Microcystin-dependent protein n=1 Tax=Granulicella arctica TaxID=940613 RepID=A0A7Y9PIX9_9BACT|nr:tail fiber protein [Granulicella arctica]NYF80594.1 microcystin-dependent protein [Granulicella arctica]
MSEPFVGEIRVAGFNFAPVGWALCQGQLLPISQNTALFSLLGTFYGGNGTSNFALPNLQGSIAIGMGQGAGLSVYDLGEVGGESVVTLNTQQMSPHSHTLPVSGAAGRVSAPSPSSFLGATGRGVKGIYASSAQQASSPVNMASSAVVSTGGGQAHNNMGPYLVLNYIIALQGVFPARS